jgi:cobalt-zinc-cadmium efflux system outer membrane protein
MKHFVLAAVFLYHPGLAQTGAAQVSSEARSLSQFVEEARENHPLLVAVRERVLVARGVSIQAGRWLNPEISVSSENIPLSSQEDFNFSSDLDWFAIYSQTFEIGKRSHRKAAADQGVEVALAQQAAWERKVIYEVKAAYERCLAARDRLELTTGSLERFQQLVDLNEIRVREGYIAEGDLIRTRLEAQRFGYGVRQAALGYEQAKIELLRLTGATSFDTDFRLEKPEELRLETIDLEMVRQAALTRPEIRIAEARFAQAESFLHLGQAQAKPDLTASFGYKRNGPDNTLFAGVSLPLPIFDQYQGTVQSARAELASVAAELELARIQVLAELEGALRTVESAQQQVDALRSDFLQRAEESRTIAIAAYTEGAADLLLVLEAERSRSVAQELFVQSDYDYRIALHGLENAAGLESLPRIPTRAAGGEGGESMLLSGNVPERRE